MEKPNPILVVEDNEISYFLTEHTLQEMGLGRKILHAPDGRAALELIRKGLQPGLIILDLQLPKMDGFAFLEAYNQLASATEPNVIVFSTSTRPQDRARANLYNCVLGYAEKPITALKLQLLLDQVKTKGR